jgi:hypothetical protein
VIDVRALCALALRAVIVWLSTPFLRFLGAVERLADHLEAPPLPSRPVATDPARRRQSFAIFLPWFVTGSVMVTLAWWAV